MRTLKSEQIIFHAERLSLVEDGKEIAHAYLYYQKNNLHDQPLAVLEDVFVNETHRKSGVGRELMEKVLLSAINSGCYKVIATSRFGKRWLHKFYEKLGFKKVGYSFRINLPVT